jgi:hypothetical protein
MFERLERLISDELKRTNETTHQTTLKLRTAINDNPELHHIRHVYADSLESQGYHLVATLQRVFAGKMEQSMANDLLKALTKLMEDEMRRRENPAVG